MVKLRQPQILLSPGFLAGLLLLLVNDFLLKQQFHNWLTGKLSDLAGLFIFPMFLAAFLPSWKGHIYLATAMCFAFWKSLYSQPLIDMMNHSLPFTFGRTADTSDLLALLVLPMSYLYRLSYLSVRQEQNSFAQPKQTAIYAVGLISLIAFTATQMVDDQTVSYEKEYEFNVSREELIRQLYNTDLKNIHYSRLEETPTPWPNSEDRDLYTVSLRKKICKSNGIAYMNVYTLGDGRSSLKLDFIFYRCDAKEPEHERKLLEDFENEVVDKLRQQQ